MSSDPLFEVPANIARNTRVDARRYRELYDESVNDQLGFWRRQGQHRVDAPAQLLRIAMTAAGMEADTVMPA